MKSALIMCFALLSACSTVKTAKNADTYLDTVRLTYEAGEKALKDEDFEDAIKSFEEVRTKYPYSKYAALSDLKLADTYFAQEKWLEAADAYDFYVRFHPRHEQNAYAWFQIAKAYFHAIPREFFIFPKSYVKDQTATQEALEAVQRYLTEYPSDKNAEEAEKMRVHLRSQLALRDLHIAEYYAKRRKTKGALTRFEHVVKQYGDTPAGEIAKQRILEYTKGPVAHGGDMGSTEDENKK
ncbi:MAG: outer membrane protein assembly factor BamD [Myxococcaceae bacterium]